MAQQVSFERTPGSVPANIGGTSWTFDKSYGGLSLAIEGPGKADFAKKDNSDGSQIVSYKPTQEGSYKISIRFADEHVPGSPFNCKVGGISKAKEESTISRTLALVETTHAGSICELNLKVPGSDPMEMISSITSPSGVTELCDIVDQRDEHYTIKFTPQEMGVHTVQVKHKGLHVQGSPFLFTVGAIVEGGPHKAHANGPGLERGEVGEDNEFNIYTREAGVGALTVAIEGPSKPTITFEDQFVGSSIINYKCSEPGEYTLSVKFNDEHVPDSPFRVPVRPSSGDARKVTVQSLKQKGLEIGKPVAFTTVFNGAKGQLTARVVAPSGAEDEAVIQSLDDSGGHYAVRFIPRENGVHYIHIQLDENHIRGSPFRCVVGESVPDPGMVTAGGEGLVKGTAGQGSKFTVKTVGSGASTLSVTVDGPSKAALSTQDIADGYDFEWVPACSGTYYIAVKYGGNFHIAGSPFKAVVTGGGKPSAHREHAHCVVETVNKSESTGPTLPKFNSDASKVVSKGLGLNKAFVNRTAQFNVDVSQAGKNLLFVGLVGPSNSSPVDEVIIKHGMRNTYNCSYTIKQKGKYFLIVRYGEQNIPGSPFLVNVV